MKPSQNIIKVALLVALLSYAPRAKAEISPGEVWGIAWTIGNAIQGTTTLTPAYALDTWNHNYKVKNFPSGTTSRLKLRVKLDFITKHYFYSTEAVSISGAATNHTNPFMLGGINQLNYDVDWTNQVTGVIFRTEQYLQNSTFRVWLAKVEKTGLWPDDGPWTVYLKTSGNKARFPLRRFFPEPGADVFFWAPASLRQSGSEVVKLGTPTCYLTYPPYCASEFYN